jgi:hypothetical protein
MMKDATIAEKRPVSQIVTVMDTGTSRYEDLRTQGHHLRRLSSRRLIFCHNHRRSSDIRTTPAPLYPRGL